MKRVALVFAIALPALVNAESMASFEKIVNSCKAAFAAEPSSKVFSDAERKMWTKRLGTPATIRSGVRKKESLTSPYAAHIEVTEASVTKAATDEQAANALEVSFKDGPIVRQTRRLNFVFQSKEGVWVLTSGSLGVASKKDGNSPYVENPMTTALSKDAFTSDPGPIKACLPTK